ncbi:MAG: transcription-repair coupling factor [Phycisphaeraceae bacterium]|nr:transcription-repair coupling factor [Phycisphaeraceae bacterium]
MKLSQHRWLSTILDDPAVVALCDRLGQHPAEPIGADGSQGSSTTLIAAAIALRTKRPTLLVVAHLDDADDAMDDLRLLSAAGMNLPTSRFGALEVLPGETTVSLELLSERLSLVGRLAGSSTLKDAHLIVAPIQALMQGVPEPDALGDLTLTLKAGQDMPPAQLLDWLTRTGYQRVDAIEQPGEFAGRGGIIDIFPPAGAAVDHSPESETNAAGPVRLDFFGDTVETICRIDPQTMGSGQRLQSIHILGADPKLLQSESRTTSLLTLLPRDCVAVLHEIMELSEQARGYYERLTNPLGIYSPNAVFRSLTTRPCVQVNQYGRSAQTNAVKLPLQPLASFHQDAAEAVKELAAMAGGEDAPQVVALCPKPAERDRLLELLREHAPKDVDRVTVEVGYLHRGFHWAASPMLSKAKRGDPPEAPPEALCSLTLVPHQELFHRYDVHRRVRRIGVSADAEGVSRASDAFLDLAPGDYVVHSEHGIARFVGLRILRAKGEGEGPAEEFITLEFAGQATLHVPMAQIDLVAKYVGGFQGAPPLSQLGGKRWSKQKQQVAEAVKDLAAQLLRIQAARSSMPGVTYPADTAWQKEFEAEFPYDETDDQLAAIAAVKRDMARPQPMDRLLCGDVGFGKTEVAIRAAFKAAEFGKQVAVLVPTTVLAEQHERTFRSRMADYPFRIEAISRFRTAGEQKALIDKLGKGQVDVIIGTHRLLSKDVKFADLGLVIIDEEQRFGVEHKSRLLEFRLTADVMTLSATPIPRTLHMAMLGLRDISSLTTAPADRRAIVTEVIPYNKERVRRAIIRELNREGQIYFVHNRVHDIQCVADDIHRLVPEARVIFGHGQMTGHELEKVMLQFIRRKADVLVCTTIIESGIDIPTANTIFINQADHFGLADLHQLRGRVGRYKHRAYCYLMLPDDRPITDKAAQRLKAVEQYSMLGAGFKIAMRDLEIRGAGNILGPEQSGHIAAVGYDMYCQLLEQETRKLRKETVVETNRTHVELPATGQLPRSYITSDKFRMEAYRRLSRASAMTQLDAVLRDLTDAYGKPPPQAQTFIDLAELRLALTLLHVDALKLDGPDLIFRTQKPQQLVPVLNGAPGRVSLIDETTVYYRPPTNYLTPTDTLLAVLRKLLVKPVRDGEKKAEAGA